MDGGTHSCTDPKTNRSNGLCPANCEQIMFVSLFRYESLAHALAGRANGTAWGPTRTVLGGTNDSVLCVNWEDPTLYVDQRGHFHVLAHAFRGQAGDWPQPGCRKTQNVSKGSPPGWEMSYPGPCTSNGGHAYSIDGKEWHISPVPPYTASTDFEDGSTVVWRARERPHVVLNEHGELAFLLNGVGDPITVNCTDGPSTPGKIPTDPKACQCPGSEFYPCPPQTGGENTGGPGGDHTFTLLQPIATAASLRTAAALELVSLKADDESMIRTSSGGWKLDNLLQLDASAGRYTQTRVAADGRATIVLNGDGKANSGLRIARCADASCSSTTSAVTVPDTDPNPRYIRLELDQGSLPVLVYCAKGNTEVHLTRCKDPLCHGSSTTVLATAKRTRHCDLRLVAGAAVVITELSGDGTELRAITTERNGTVSQNRTIATSTTPYDCLLPKSDMCTRMYGYNQTCEDCNLPTGGLEDPTLISGATDGDPMSVAYWDVVARELRIVRIAI